MADHFEGKILSSRKVFIYSNLIRFKPWVLLLLQIL
jgi:hypothetical protein